MVISERFVVFLAEWRGDVLVAGCSTSREELGEIWERRSLVLTLGERSQLLTVAATVSLLTEGRQLSTGTKLATMKVVDVVQPLIIVFH